MRKYTHIHPFNDYFLVGLLLCTLMCIVTMVQSQTQESSTSPTEADGGIDTSLVRTTSPTERDGGIENGTSPAITTSPTERDGGIDNGTSPAITTSPTERDGGIDNGTSPAILKQMKQMEVLIMAPALLY